MNAPRRSIYSRFALSILAVVFLLIPFALRGARMSLERMENNVKDWLPSDFQETQELAWFAKHFVGQQAFVLLTWEGCSEDDESFQLLVEKLRHEVIPPKQRKSAPTSETDSAYPLDAAPPVASGIAEPGEGESPTTQEDMLRRREDESARELARARALGDRLGLMVPDDVRLNWGGLQEKWLQGDHQSWYYITPDGSLYRWTGKQNVLDGLTRAFRRYVLGNKRARGEFVARFGKPTTEHETNDFYANPERLTARILTGVVTGPEVMEELTRPGGSLYPVGGDLSEEGRRLEARRQALNRLTGALFGPGPASRYDWTVDGLPKVLDAEHQQALPKEWRTAAREYLERLVEKKFKGNRKALRELPPGDQEYYFAALCRKLGIEPPAVPTCIMVTLSDPATRDLRRVLGRGVLGKPRGKLIRLAESAGVVPPPKPPLSPFSPEPDLSGRVLRLGGPPVDNVAIDEEGSITLARLIGFCIILGFGLSYLCFRSIEAMIMIFFVGGVSALASLAIVWWNGSSVDAILLSMPALVYVLGLSGAVHIVNYYRESAETGGFDGAEDRAVKHGFVPCTLAAFTTALGLMSLYNSNIIPIKKFGLYSALGVMATLILLFTYLPAALAIWQPFRKTLNQPSSGETLHQWVTAFWQRLGRFIVHRHAWVAVGCLAVMVAFGLGLTKLNTSIQLLKLFDQNAKIIRDYAWLERHLGKLVPMELVVRVDESRIRRPVAQLEADVSDEELRRELYRYSFLERAEMAMLVQQAVEEVFGEHGVDIVGRGMSVTTFLPPIPDPGSRQRVTLNRLLEENRQRLLEEDYLALDDDGKSELWRVSIRLAALKDVDYGEFVRELKRVVEPVMKAYQYRDQILTAVERELDNEARSTSAIWNGGRICVLGAPSPGTPIHATRDEQGNLQVPQTPLFGNTLYRLLRVKGFRSQGPKRYLLWHDPQARPFPEGYATSEKWGKVLEACQVVVLISDDPGYDLEFVKQHARVFIDARNHRFIPPVEKRHWRPTLATFKQVIPIVGRVEAEKPRTHVSLDDPTATAKEKGLPLQVTYTGVVPIVYKAQRTLLESLINSIISAFFMIGAVMTLLLMWGSWRARNLPSGLLSMLPNVFPVVIIFGFMGHRRVLIDIGTMMCTSVAMGVAVDDTIHFLAWFRHACRMGMSRREAILESYRRVATAMTQTTLIGGLGLAVFSFSTFTPTQRFGTMMLTLLLAALVGDLIMLPALLAGPLGRFFVPKPSKKAGAVGGDGGAPAAGEPVEPFEAGGASPPPPHQPASQPQAHKIVRRNSGHT